jgi:hypothetical protein
MGDLLKEAWATARPRIPDKLFGVGVKEVA